LTFNASFFTNSTSKATLEQLYSADPAQGSPFGTGEEEFFGPQFKRSAAVYGDLHFQAPRRNWLKIAVAQGIDAWSYLFDQAPPGSMAWEGVYHTSEIPYVFMDINGTADPTLYSLAQQTLAYWVSFAYNLDPNYSANPQWEKYSVASEVLNMTAKCTYLIPDTYRNAGMNFLLSIADQFLEAP